jgi:hypothetical protein
MVTRVPIPGERPLDKWSDALGHFRRAKPVNFSRVPKGGEPVRVEQSRWTAASGWAPAFPSGLGDAASLVLVFGSRELLGEGSLLRELREAHQGVPLFGCSTAGEILGTQVRDDSLVASVVRFEATGIRLARVSVGCPADSLDAGRRLGAALPPEDLVHVLVLTDGLRVNGTEFVDGLMAELPRGVTATGGLSGDAERFQETLVVTGEHAETAAAAAVGLYGHRLRVGFGSLGGWDPFGPERTITRSAGNVLYELDGRSALALYQEYLGEHAAGLPATGLLFPLSLRRGGEAGDPGLVRTILSVNDAAQSLTFAGDVPEGSFARLMKANFNRLIDGAVGAADRSLEALAGAEASLGILISCIGRKMVLKQRVEEEVEGVREVVGPSAALTGFYSYGEISPFTPSARCELHNQTMTVTLLSEGY